MLPWLGVLVVVALLTASGHLLFKLAALGDRPWRRRLRDRRLLLGCALFAVAPVLTYLAARHLDFSVVYAVTALNFPCVTLLAWRVLREPVDRRKVLGMVGILAGLGIFLFG